MQLVYERFLLNRLEDSFVDKFHKYSFVRKFRKDVVTADELLSSYSNFFCFSIENSFVGSKILCEFEVIAGL